jgi:glycosyltransferase involved in cell wall biosynthesis
MNGGSDEVPEVRVDRKPRLLWANAYCLLDTSSGASMAVREMLRQLAMRGFQVAILGATVFDHESGRSALSAYLDNRAPGSVLRLRDGYLEHQILIVGSMDRSEMTSHEELLWHQLYTGLLDSFKPDLVMFYGGQTLDYLIPDEAVSRRIPVVAYLANGNYYGSRWCRDVTLIITDSQATAEHYRLKDGIEVVPVGTFIDPSRVVADKHHRRNLLFINPVPEKGVAVVIQLAVWLGRLRPDIMIEVVESRGKGWAGFVETVNSRLGEPQNSLDNVLLTPHTTDMRPVYGRARLLLAPSLWWESGPRVAAEAMLNGIPAIITDQGGAPEMTGNASIKLQLPRICHEEPYRHLPGNDLIRSLADRIIDLYDNESHYTEYVRRAYRVAGTVHSIDLNVQRLLAVLAPLL